MSLIYSADSNNYNLEKIKLANKLKPIISKDSIFFCIGTDKLIFDSLGPLVGYKLKERASYLNIYGCLEFPINAINLNEQIELVKQKQSQIIAIDATLTTNPDFINHAQLHNGPAYPGGGIGKVPMNVGDYKITGIIDIKDNPDMFRKAIRLYHVNLLADLITDSILIALEIN